MRTPRRTIDTIALYDAIDTRRRLLGLTWETTVRQITGNPAPSRGLPARLRAGRPVSADVLGAILMWLGTDSVTPFLIATGPRRYVP